MTQYIVRKRERINSIINRIKILIFPLKLSGKTNFLYTKQEQHNKKLTENVQIYTFVRIISEINLNFAI